MVVSSDSTRTSLLAMEPVYFTSTTGNRRFLYGAAQLTDPNSMFYYLNNTYLDELGEHIRPHLSTTNWSIRKAGFYEYDQTETMTCVVSYPTESTYRNTTTGLAFFGSGKLPRISQILRPLSYNEYGYYPQVGGEGSAVISYGNASVSTAHKIFPFFYVRNSLELDENGDMVTNKAPTITLSTIDNRTLYENDIYTIDGSTLEPDSGNVVSVKYSIDGGAPKAILANVSTGSAVSFAKNLTYKAGALYDGAAAVTGILAEGSQHSLTVWAEDDKGGKSPEIIRSFYVVPNRAATLTLDAFVKRTGLINTDVVNISGKVADLDNGNVIVKYKIGNGAFIQVFNSTVGATPTPFNFNVLLADLTEGDNQITIQAVDAYNAITQQVLTIRKNKNEVPMLEAVTYYEIIPPNGSSDGLQLYVEREVGDLVVAVDVYMGASGQSEVFVPMTLASTANLTNGNVEDTFSYEHGADASKIVVRIKMTRSSGASNKAIKKISGVLT